MRPVVWSCRIRALPRVAVVLVVVLGAAAAMAGEAPSLRLPDVWPPEEPAIVELELAGRSARVATDLAEIDRLDRMLVTEYADRDWALIGLAKNLRSRVGLAAARSLLAHPDSLPPSLRALPPHALAVMQGVLDCEADRYASASAAFERALVARPDWANCHAYLFLCAAPLLRPLTYVQEQVDGCANDALALGIIIDALVWELRHEPDDPLFVRTLALVEAASGSSLLEEVRAQLEIVHALRTAAPDPRAVAAAWRAVEARYGRFAWLSVDMAAREICDLLTTGESLQLLAELGRDPRGAGFRQCQAWLLAGVDRLAEARRVGQDDLRPQAADWLLNLLVTDQLDDGPTLRARMQRVLESCVPWQYAAQLREAAGTFEDRGYWPAFWSLLERENPSGAVRHRLGELGADRAAERTTLLDSLAALALVPDHFADDRRENRALAGEGPSLAEILAVGDRERRSRLLREAAQRAELTGNSAEASRILGARLDAEAGRAPALYALLAESWDRGDWPLAERAIAAHAAALPGDARTEMAAVNQTIQSAGRETAVARLKTIDYLGWTEPVQLSRLAAMARWLELTDLAVAIDRRALDLAPGAFEPRLLMADLLVDKLQHAAADSIYALLAAEYPGSQKLAQRRMVSGASVVSLASTPRDSGSLDQMLQPFDYRLDDIAAVRALALTGARADSVQDDVVVLQERMSDVLTDRNGAYHRWRRIVQVMSAAGADEARVLVVVFAPSEGVPQLRVARVLTADGAVVDVDRSEIQIRAPGNEQSDVTDSREMVIPFARLAPGAIIDLAYDTTSRDYLAGGWSNLLTFGRGWRTLEYLYEVLTPADATLHAVVANGLVPVSGYADPRLRGWRLLDPKRHGDEDWAPPYEDSAPWIGLTTYDDWDALGREYASSFWKTAVADDAVRAEATRLCRGLRSREDKAAALYRFVAEEIDPLAVELGAGRIIPAPPGQVLARRWGDCKDCSCLLIALLEAAGIEARPVLVSTSEHRTPRQDLPTIDAFDHMIVQITGLAGRPYCDPLNGTDCLSPVPAASVGRLGLHCDRAGAATLATVTETVPEDHGSVMTVDVTPQGELGLRYDITANYRGEFASYMRAQVASNDSSQVRSNLDGSVGYGLPANVPIRSWSTRTLACGELEVRMAYVDTAWAEAGDTSAEVRLKNEGPIYWGLPSSQGRRQDVEFRSPYTTRMVLRLHGSANWMPSERLVEYASSDSLCSGSTTVERTVEDGRPLIIVTQDFRLPRRTIRRDDYQAFRRQANAHYSYGSRRYRYHRVIDEKVLDRALAYAEEFPDDHAFRIRAATELLGKTFGGVDEQGLRRRALARQLLAPVLKRAMSADVAIIAAALECVDGHYARGDSIVDAAIAGGASSALLTQVTIGIKRQLYDVEGEIAALQAAANQYGSTEMIELLIQSLLVANRPEEADRQCRRLEMMGTPTDSLKLHMTRFLAFQRRGEGEAMARELERMDPLLNEPARDRLLLALHQTRDRFEDSLPILEKLLAEDPTSEVFCNDLAWTLAMLGRELPRAEMLAQAACAMADDPDASLNTLGVVYAREGRWDEARVIFERLYHGDDRPDHRLVNGFYLGVAECALGRRDAGQRIWAELDGLPGERSWHARLEAGRKALAQGERLDAAAFAEPVAPR